MRKFLFVLLGSFLIFNVVAQNNQDYGTQIPNSDFESPWQIYTGGKKISGSVSGNEPYHWHSFMSATGAKLVLAAVKNQIAQDGNTRPGSTGSSSVRLYATKTLSVIANGSLTNGRMNCGSTSASSNENNIYTDRGSGDFNMPFTGPVPDSLTIWVSFYTTSDANTAAIHAAVHGDANFILYGNGTQSDQSMQVANAELNYKRTTTDKGTLKWERKSIPFEPMGNCTEIKYLLVSMSTNNVPANGSENDVVYLDDIVLIYNPTLKTGVLAETNFEAEHNTEIPIEVPFTLTGSMSVSNLNVAANQVIAQLSDANGSFDNPIEIGRVTTNTSGTVSAKIPASVGDGTYKVRVVSTNYPMTAEPSSSQISITRYYTIAFADLDENIATLQGAGKYYVANTETITVSATAASSEYDFAYWFEDGTAVSLDAEYTFTAEKSRLLQAVFKKQCTVSVVSTEGGEVKFQDGKYAEGQGLSITATPDEGYSFLGWKVNDEVVSTNATYSFSVSEDVTLTAVFAKAVSIVATVNIDGVGAVSGAGVYTLENADEVSVSLYAVSNDEDTYRFVNWTENGEIVSTSPSYEFTTSENRTLVANFEKLVRITVSSSDETCVATGAGIYTTGTTVNLFAMPDGNTEFVGWFEADTLFSAATSVEFVADADRTFVAVFGQVYTVTVQMNIDGAAQISGAGTYQNGALVELSVVPNDGFVFENWTIQGEEVSAEPTFTFEADSSVAIVANFTELEKYTITAVADVPAAGTVLGAGTYYEGADVTITAVPNNGYEFVNWTENDEVIGEEPTLSFTAQEQKNVVAHFEANFEGYTVSLNVEEGGIVSGAGLYPAESEVTVTAESQGKYSFIAWNDSEGNELSTDASYTFVITSDVALTAVFERFYSKYTIEVVSADEQAGTVSGSGKYTEDDEVTVTALPNDGYRFWRWTSNGVEVSTSAEYTFVCEKKLSLQAEFKKIYTVQIADFEGGSVKGLTTDVFDENEQVTLVISLDENYTFVAWKNAETDQVLSESLVYTFTVTANIRLAVELKEKGKLCTVSVQTGGTVSGLRNGQYEAGETVTLIATPSEGYLFDGWVQDGQVVSTETRLSFVVSDNVNIYARFIPEPQKVTVTVATNDETFGSVIGDGEYTEGDEITLIATPENGYEFVAWKKDGKILSNLPTLYYTIVDDCTIEAEFRFIEKTAVAEVGEETIRVYPNPATTTLYVNSEAEIAAVQLVSLQGQVVYQENVNGGEIAIDVQQIKKGLYVLVIEHVGTVSRQQVVIK